MPAIVKSERDWLAEGNAPETAGQVNYLITLLFHSYLTNYQSINDMATEVDYAIHSLISDGYYKSKFKFDFSGEFTEIIMTADVPTYELVGALRNCYSEFYRMKVALYEDKKYEINGPV